MDMLELLKSCRIIAIMRGIPYDHAEKAAAALIQGGIRIMEVTMNTERALDILAMWRSKFGHQARIGAGTVLDVEMAEQAVQAGAQFLVSPNLDERVIEYGIQRGVEVWPGVLTPTEIVRAWKAGARAVKIFPMKSMGIEYLR